MTKLTWRYWIAGLVALVALAGVATGANAAFPGAPSAPNAKPATTAHDDFDSLPAGLKAVSYSTLVTSGKVHVFKGTPAQPGTWQNPFAPLLNIVWGPDRVTAAGAGEPAAGINQTLPLNALISGNFSLDHTTDGGATWVSIQPPNPHNSGDVTNAWLENAPSNALELAINNSGGYDYTCARTTDFGATWTTDTGCGTSVSSPTYFDDREYIWVDHNPASPFYGRVYVTTAYFDAGGSGSFNTVSNRWSSDNGATWNPPNTVPLALVPNNEFALGIAHNEYPSLGISADGTLGYAWHRGLCCGGSPTVGTNNKVMFARSSDGGVSFPFSNTVVTVPLNQAVPFNSTSPFNQRWSDTPNIAADPVTNGTFYAIWTQYRTPSTAASAAIYLSKTTDNGANWSTPVIPYNNPNAAIFQGFGWVKVTADHTVHVTYLGGTTSNTSAGQFYVQSTDGGTTWTAPFQLNTNPITTFASTTDYEANDVTIGAGTGAIIAGWDEGSGHHARIGTFLQGTPTPTVTGTPPTATQTRTPTITPTRTNTPSATATVNPCLVQNYVIATATGSSIISGTVDTGNHCDDCATSITLPFAFALYGQSYTTAMETSNGQFDFGTADPSFSNTCLPDAATQAAIFPHWDDLRTDTGTGCTSYASGCGIFSSVTGTAPNRVFHLEWRAAYFDGAGQANFELRLYEGQNRFDVVYGTLAESGSSATVGVQNTTGSLFTQFECNTGGLSSGLQLIFTLPTCGTATVTPTGGPATATATTAVGTATATPVCGGPAAWQAGPTLTPARYAMQAVLGSDNLLYVAGGQSADAVPTVYGQVARFDPASSTWATVSPLPTPVGQAATGAWNGKIYVAGGFVGGTSITNGLQIYDIASGTWSAGPAMPTSPGVEAAAGAVVNGKFYVMGGDDNTTSLGTTYIYDTGTNTWSSGAAMPDTRTNTYGTAAGGLIYVYGGVVYPAFTTVDTLLRYDPVANSWTNLGSAGTASLGNYGSISPYGTGQLLIADGADRTGVSTTSTHLFNIGTGTFSAGPAMIGNRAGQAQGQVPDGRVLVVDGFNTATTTTSAVEVLRPVVCLTPTPATTPTATVAPPSATVTATAPANLTPTVSPTPRPPTPGTPPPVATMTLVPSPTPTASPTPRPPTPGTPPPVATMTLVPSPTRPPTATATACTISFTDVHQADYFYTPVLYLACHGVISGYNDGTYRPYNNTTRSQMVKIVVLGFQKVITTPSAGNYTFTDVQPAFPFFAVIETAAADNIVSGYVCGGPGEPCDAQHRNYFRPFANVTRGQLAKIVTVAAAWALLNPPTGTFADVLPGSVFYEFAETAYCHGVISGYACGGVGEPCDAQHRPYFRPYNNATRGQIAKIVYLALTNPVPPGTCQITPGPQ